MQTVTPPIRPNKITVAEYGDLTKEDFTTRTVIERRYMRGETRSAALVMSSSGFECAGSLARWTDAYWAVETYIDGSRHGRRFKNEADAVALFDRWTKGGAS